MVEGAMFASASGTSHFCIPYFVPQPGWSPSVSPVHYNLRHAPVILELAET